MIYGLLIHLGRNMWGSDTVADLIRDVAEIFGRPRFIHLGWDEEKFKAQRKGYDYVSFRQGELWWNDMLFTANEAKRNGMRPWIWSDKEWMAKDEFMEKCPRDIVQSQWYYGPFFGGKWGGDGSRGKYLDAVDQLAGARGMVERFFAKEN